MAQQVEANPLEAAYAALLKHGLDGAGEALRILVNEAAKIERPISRCGTARTLARATRLRQRLQTQDAADAPWRDHLRRAPNPRVRLLPKRPRKGFAYRTGAESGARRDVRAGRLHPQGDRDPPAARRPRSIDLLDEGEPRDGAARRGACREAASARLA